ncbi:MAG: division/cell wall cluster transcriptional repressor MraZ [Acidobacteria bacterium]|nr:division/cell wall cluster transcriptional repressor MraZ [Acidobacteriota bacterium]
MLRGNHTARIDDKGRLKIPTPFRRLLEDRYGLLLYITSLTGECARIYPMPEWVAIETRLLALPVMDPARRKFLDRTNYYGQEAEMDTQGRVLIPYQLRSKAEMLGDVAVLGYLNYLEVWSLERFEARLAADPFTDDDAAALARLGI